MGLEVQSTLRFISAAVAMESKPSLCKRRCIVCNLVFGTP